MRLCDLERAVNLSKDYKILREKLAMLACPIQMASIEMTNAQYGIQSYYMPVTDGIVIHMRQQIQEDLDMVEMKLKNLGVNL